MLFLSEDKYEEEEEERPTYLLSAMTESKVLSILMRAKQTYLIKNVQNLTTMKTTVSIIC